jgi:AraC-like DNA-binding protein
MRLATVTPIGAFPLIDYLIVTSEDVGEGLSRLERYLRLAEARSIPSLRRAENPIRVAYLLGYSEPAAFNRAFRCWHHETPQSFRQRQRTGRVQ